MNFGHHFARLISPLAATWSQAREKSILLHGIPMPEEAVRFARGLGIRRPEELRLEVVRRIPLPIPDSMADAARAAGFPVMKPSAMCLGRGISTTSLDFRLLRHELIHTLQYQNLGGHRPFMRQYLFECLTYGYDAAPMEIEARERAQGA